ncbi:RNA polymerase subunit sigma [Planctomicrobium sp. SH661]|uniref:RNA polymerase subunit sigma n=1 Tax=Planctomicrobium sp. SH661 TaxID=3448124 RepID=UPI003F5AFF91
MSGPIVRTGATPEFWNNWDQVFGKKSKAAAKVEPKPEAQEKSDKPAAKKKTVVAKPAAAKSTAKKAAAPKAAKKASKKK